MKKRRKSRAKNARPKGSYPLPTGGYVTEHVHVGASGKRIRVRGIRRDQPDVRKLMHALIEIAKKDDESTQKARHFGDRTTVRSRWYTGAVMAESAIYDRSGRPVIYIVDDGSIYTWGGEAVAYLDGEHVYGWSGAHLGWWRDGVMYNSSGAPIGYTAARCPVVTHVERVKSVQRVQHVRGVQRVAPVQPVLTRAPQVRTLKRSSGETGSEIATH